MKYIKIRYQYDGSSFFGFQRQPKKRTVQGEIEKALALLLQEEVNLISSGRTDRGVHALEQVSNFSTNSKIPLENLTYALRKSLPPDILLLDLEEVDETFHARYSAQHRTYLYRLTWKASPFRWRYVSQVKKKMEKETLENILKQYLGEHNFQNFRLQDDAYANPQRKIYEIYCEEVEDGLNIYIRANAFLKSQIRIMLGTAFAVYEGRVEAERIQMMLEQPEKSFPKMLAPGEGLYLYKIAYEVGEEVE